MNLNKIADLAMLREGCEALIRINGDNDELIEHHLRMIHAHLLKKFDEIGLLHAQMIFVQSREATLTERLSANTNN